MYLCTICQDWNRWTNERNERVQNCTDTHHMLVLSRMVDFVRSVARSLLWLWVRCASVILMWTKHFIYNIHRVIYRSTEYQDAVSFCFFFFFLLHYTFISLDRRFLSCSFSYDSQWFVCLFIRCVFSFVILSYCAVKQWNEFFFGLGKTPEMQKPRNEMHHFIKHIYIKQTKRRRDKKNRMST